MWILAIFPILFPISSAEFRCGGDHTHIDPSPSSMRSVQTRSGTLAPIRISYFYSNFDLGNTTLNSYFNATLLPSVTSFFTNSLSVYSITGNLILSAGTCYTGVTIPTAHTTTGVPNTDIIIYLTTTTQTGTSIIAMAGACKLQSNGLNNPIAGFSVVYNSNFNNLNYGSQLSVMTHEFTHIFGFSSGLYKYWKGSNGLPYASVTANATMRGAPKTLIVTPNVVQAARMAFNCPTLQGVELEDADGSNSHWDKRIMFNDYMTSYLPNDPIWTNITLALLQDTGWYRVSFSLAMPPIFGRSSGCNFFTNKCVTNGVSADPNLWCTTQGGGFTCDSFALNKGFCSINTYSANLPTYFQYFSNLTLGGDSYTDYCPFKTGYSNGFCRGNGPMTTYTIAQSKEVVGLNSRCFQSTLVISPYVLNPPYSACYQVVSCTATYATVAINTTTINCPFTGGTFTVPGYNGNITCPSSDILCRDVPCINMCGARGSCSKGICNCFSGYGDVDCTWKCSANCKSCTMVGCTQCNTGYFLSSGVCLACSSNCINCTSINSCSSCTAGYYLNSGSCSICPTNCLTCTSATLCTSCVSGYTVSTGLCTITCSPYGAYCVTCSSSSCLSCATGHTLVNGVCQ